MTDRDPQTTERRTPYEQRREAMARVLSASLMGLVKDAAGASLPEDCWRQMTAKADAILFIVSTGAEHESAGKSLERHLSGDYHGPG